MRSSRKSMQSSVSQAHPRLTEAKLWERDSLHLWYYEKDSFRESNAPGIWDPLLLVQAVQRKGKSPEGNARENRTSRGCVCVFVCVGRKIICHLPCWLRLQRIHLQCRRPGFSLWVGKIPQRRAWQLTPAFLLGKFHGQRSLVGCSPWGQKESDMTEWLTTHA